MRAQISSQLIVGLVLASLATFGCGKKSKSDNADVTISPSMPIVITGNFSYNNNGSVVNVVGPWIKFAVGLNNQTGSELTIVSMSLEVTGADSTGAPKTASTTYDPSMSNYSTDVLTCAYTDFGDYANKDNHNIGIKSSNPNCVSGSLMFYASGLPDPGNTGNFTFSSKLKLLGWFGSPDSPKDRFERTVYFQTQ